MKNWGTLGLEAVKALLGSIPTKYQPKATTLTCVLVWMVALVLILA